MDVYDREPTVEGTMITGKQFLNAYWLRPENALWRTIDVNVMRDFVFTDDSLDLGCGDGVFSFIRAGGQFADTFDIFQNVKDIDAYFDDTDIYDCCDDSHSVFIGKGANYRIGTAFDHKKSLLSKASPLKLYRDFVVGDANERFPFDDHSFSSVFSNIIYWLDDPHHAFSEIARVLKPGGTCLVMLPNTASVEFSFYLQHVTINKNPDYGFLKLIDRWRSSKYKHAKSGKEWEAVFKGVGLDVRSHKEHISRETFRVWDIGLRPLFPLLLKMTRKLNPGDLLEIKQEWVELLIQFLLPLAEMDSKNCKRSGSAFHCYTLQAR